MSRDLIGRGAAGALLAFCGLFGPAPVNAQNPNYPLPLRFETARFEVVVVDELAAGLTIGAESMERLLGLCANVLPLAPSDSVRAVEAALRVPNAHTEGTITFLAVQRTAVRAECGDRDNQWRWAPTRGVFIALDSSGIAGARFLGATVNRGTESVAGTQVTVLPSIWLTAEGIVEAPEGLIQVKVPARSILPSGMESVQALWIDFVVDSASAPIRVAVPAEVVRGLRERRLMTSFARATASPPDPSMVFVLPDQPRDEILRESYRAYARGNHAAASRLAVERLRDGNLEPAEIRSARVQLGLIALGYGDSASAQFLFDAAVAADPCLALSADAAVNSREFVNAINAAYAASHPRNRCRLTPLALVALRGALLPGFGRPVGQLRRSAATGTAAIVSAIFVHGYLMGEESAAEYERYLAAAPFSGESGANARARITSIYKRSESMRTTSLTIYRVGATIWIGSAAEAVLSERRAHRRAAVLGNYGSAPSAGVARLPSVRPLIAGDRVGLSISFF